MRIALMLRSSEKRILHASLEAVSRLLLPQLKALLDDAAAQEATCRTTGQSWAKMLTRRGSILTNAQNASRVHRTFERLRACTLGAGEATSALSAQSCATLFMLLGGLGSHPLAPSTAFVSEASAFVVKAAPVDVGDETAAAALLPPLPPLSPAMLAVGGVAAGGDQGGALELSYLALYCEKMRFWSSYLLAQWGVARALAVAETQVMQQEAALLREAWSYAIPTEEALRTIAKHAPIVELAAGNGHWAAALRRRAIDSLAYDTRCWSDSFGGAGGAGAGNAEPGAQLMGEREKDVVVEGGPESGGRHSDRALLLVWPDYHGRGTYASQCLRAYKGETLLLVGEWCGHTFGSTASAAGCDEEGQAFSPAFQREVEARFELVEQVRLPSWPCTLDALRVWKRHG